MRVTEEWYKQWKKNLGKLSVKAHKTSRKGGTSVKSVNETAFKGKFTGISKRAGVMNKTETRYTEYLYRLKLCGSIESYHYEKMKFRVLDGSFYTPDFLVICKDHIEFHEVKGSYQLDRLGKSKFLQASELYPYFRWVMMSWQKGEWVNLFDNKA